MAGDRWDLKKTALMRKINEFGGEGGIRTHGTLQYA